MSMSSATDTGVSFQVIDWVSGVYDDEEGVSKYLIELFGRDIDNKSVYVKVKNFTPYFFIEIDKKWSTVQIDTLLNYVKTRVSGNEKYRQLEEGYYVNNFIDYRIVEKHRFYGFTDYSKFKFMQLIFNNYESMRAFESVFRKKLFIHTLMKNKKPLKIQIYESNIEPMLRCMHTRKLGAVGWINIETKNIKPVKDVKTCCDINIETVWTALNPIQNDKIQPFIIASYDIECDSADGSFPNPERDAVIQIGTTFSRVGEKECYRKHILTLGTCDEIPDVEIESYQDEKKLLLAWVKLIRKSNPDIITGYNIFGFDFDYLYRRSKHLGIDIHFDKLSRLVDEHSIFKEQKLESSALGQNIMKYYIMKGRVLIDLMKVLQRDFKLASYKLDYAASFFIKEQINKLVINNELSQSTIITKSIDGIHEGQYITIYYNDGITDTKHMDGKKFQILELNKGDLIINVDKNGKESKTQFYNIVVNNIIDDEIMSSGFKVFWCQAKDDISPQDIFRLQKGSSKDRAIIAKYCIQDCALVNKLLAKLSVVVNNIGMANVCNVPLSYLFMRGQGVKIFSLVSKKCREMNHLIKVVVKKQKKVITEEEAKKLELEAKEAGNLEKFATILSKKGSNNYDDDEDSEDDEGGYEGATVFDPVKGIHYDPIAVLDFSSLYPSSMIYRNLSHECYIDNPAYENIEGYKYYNITYYQTNLGEDGKPIKTPIVCKFAQKKDGTKGIIPQILMELLSARGKYKKLMEAEKDPFLKSIYEGLQLAYKTTANSLYGQTGAPTSPIYMKQIAASTTATGREMLEFSRTFIEDYYSKLVNLVLHDKRKNFEKFFNDMVEHLPMEKPVPEKKFINPKEGFNSKEEFLDMFYNTIKDLLEGYRIEPKVIYGDSVTGKMPVIIRRKIMDEYIIEIKSIEDLSTTWKSYREFKIYDVGIHSKEQDDDIDFDVWSYDGWTPVKRVIRHKTNKKIYGIFTKSGYVEVSEDHSLVKANGEIITPNKCKKGDLLLINDFNFKQEELMNYKLNKSNPNRMVNQQYNYIGQCSHFPKEKVYVGEMIAPYNMEKVIFTGVCNCPEIKNRNEIVEIKDLGYIDDYVYDLETENHHFQAGVGNIVVHNTDSVFFKSNIIDMESGEKLMDKLALQITIQLGILASQTICIILPEPEAQAYEKTLWPFAILTKKRYVGNLYETDPNKYYQKSMGIVLKRRDNAPIVKVVFGGIIDQLLNKRSPEGAIAFTKKVLKNILSGKYPIDKFIITKTLKETYADRTRIVHAVLADRMAIRDPGNKPVSNDRIPYVYVQTKKKKVDLQGERVEHPDYVIKNNLKLDYLFYITNQIMKPCVQILELILDSNQAENIFGEYIRRAINHRDGFKPVKSFLKDYEEDDGIKLDCENLSDSDKEEKVIKVRGRKKVLKPIKISSNKNKKAIKKELEIIEDDDGFKLF